VKKTGLDKLLKGLFLVLVASILLLAIVRLTKADDDRYENDRENSRFANSGNTTPTTPTGSNNINNNTGTAANLAASGISGNTTTQIITETTTITLTAADVAGHNTDADCWVILFGKIYDITPLTNMHSGGNVFSCGTDQTALYQGRHSTNLNRMTSYYVADVGVPKTITRTRTITINPAQSNSTSGNTSASESNLAGNTNSESNSPSISPNPGQSAQQQPVTLASILLSIWQWFFA